MAHGDNRGRVNRMELIVEPCHALPCELETFTINGKTANHIDFGDTYDHDTENEEPGGDCEVRVFDKINCHTYDIINTCTDGNNHVSLHISSDKYTMKRKHQCN